MTDRLLFGVVLPAIAVIVVALLGWALAQRPYRRWRRLRAIFVAPRAISSRLKHDSLLGSSRRYKPYYFPRPEDATIREFIAAGKHCCVVGPPLAGKTRAVYEALKQLSPAVAVVIPRPADIELESFEMPFPINFVWSAYPLNWWKKCVLVIDDLKEFMGKKNFDYLLTQFESKGATIVATCQSGKELAVARAALTDLFYLVGGNVVPLSTLSDENGEKICQELGILWHPEGFDGNPGSLVLDLVDMRIRWQRLKERERNVLTAVRQLYRSGLHEGKDTYSVPRIKTLCEKQFGIRDVTDEQWLSLFEALKSEGFADLPDKVTVKAEEAYLVRVVEPLLEEATDLGRLRGMASVFAADAEALLLVGNRAWAYGGISVEKAEYMKLAIAAYGEALRVYTEKDFPEIHPLVQRNLARCMAFLNSE